MKKAIIACALCTALWMNTGCSASWLSTFDGYLKIAGPILIQILDIVALAKGVAPDAALQSKILADQASLNSIANSVSLASAQNLPTVCAQFNQGVSTLAADLGTIEQLANIGGKTSGEIAAILGIAQAAISEIEAPIVACQSAPTPRMAMARLQLAAVKITSPSDVVRRFNATVDSKHKVHLHSATVRYASLGLLK